MKGLTLISNSVHSDNRGYFHEIFLKKYLPKRRKDFDIVQQNHSHSVKGVLRGIHVAPWSKLIHVSSGMVQAVVVDCRKAYKTYGTYETMLLDCHTSLFVPPNCGFGFLVLSKEADVIYSTNRYWQPLKERGIAWNSLNIPWQIDNPILSEKDKNNKPL